MKLNIAICDDDLFALNEEFNILRSILYEKNIEHTIDQFDTPQELLRSETVYDIVILDIEMNECNGIETAKRIREFNEDSFIFFATNYEAYIDEALDQRAYRFWKKPLDRTRLALSIKSVLNLINNEKRNIIITSNAEPMQISAQNIMYFYIQDKKLHIITTKGEIVTNDTYQKIYEQLEERDDFCEPHRSYCVNLKYVREYTKDKVFCAYKEEKYAVYISRRKYNSFRKKFTQWLGSK